MADALLNIHIAQATFLSLDWQVWLMLAMVLASIGLYISEILPIEMVALALTTILVITGILSFSEGLSGFTNQATITIAALFVIGNTLYKTGSLNLLAGILTRQAKRGTIPLLLTLMIVVGTLSAFINNTAVVAIFIPIIIGITETNKNLKTSALLIPLSFAAIFGGLCTLIGTSTNLIVDAVSEQEGAGSLSMFDFAPMGLILFAAGIVYMLFIGKRLIPDRKALPDQESDNPKYLVNIRITEDSGLAGVKIDKSKLKKKYLIHLEVITRNGRVITDFEEEDIFEPGDILTIKAPLKQLKNLIARKEAVLGNNNLGDSENTTLVEALIPPNSRFTGKIFSRSGLEYKMHAHAIAIRDRFDEKANPLGQVRLQQGDVVLLEIDEENLSSLRRTRDVVLIRSHEFPAYKKVQSFFAIAATIAVVVLASFNLVPIYLGAPIAALLMVITRIISMGEFYEAIDWEVVFLLGGLLPFGLAIQKTGTAELLGSWITLGFAGFGPLVILAIIFLVTTLLTEVISNNGTAVIMVPIAIAVAKLMDISATPLILTVAYAGSASFLTPIGYQTNTMVYRAGNYQFTDFSKVGWPLLLIFWILTTLILPLIHPF